MHAGFSQKTDPEYLATVHKLRWLLFARWIGSIGQILTALLAHHFLQIEFNAWGIGGCIGFAVLSNLFIHWKMESIAIHTRWVVLSVLVLDSLILTAMLNWSGGAHNPFTSFYLLHVTLAAVLLPLRYALALSAMSVCGFVWLYLTAESCCESSSALLSAGISQDLHFQGMVVSLGLTALFISVFVGKIQWELNRSHAMLYRAQSDLAVQQRFRSLATLAAGVAHELATPLSTIALVSKEMESVHSELSQNDQDEDLRIIRSEVERCRAIIDRLNIENLQHETQVHPVLLKEWSVELEPQLADWTQGRGRLELEPELAHFQLRIPVGPLRSVLQALLENACDADRSGAEVLLRVREWKGMLCFEVWDQGPGVEPEILANMGEPFFTTKGPQHGMGLGLFLARVFAEQWRGSLEFSNDSTTGQGFVVKLSFPLGEGMTS